MKEFNRLNEIQAVQKQWEQKLIPEEERTPQSRFNRMMEEVVELDQAIKELDGTLDKNYEAAMELADVFIVGLGVADALGFDIERLIFEKMGVNMVKYNPVKAQELRNQGLSWQETLKVMKKQWKK
jgi:NTP pyrophosphatase (non-canonical NTP hydrolase)